MYLGQYKTDPFMVDW